MTTLQTLANEMVDDEILCFEYDGMRVEMSQDQINELKEGVLAALCDAFNQERENVNDYVRGFVHMIDEDEEDKSNA